MNDITDQDRRTAHEWAASIDPNMKCWSDRERAAASVILATVDAPAPTLAERLQEQFYDPEPTDEQGGIILDAEQMEHDLAEARAERDRLQAQVQGLARRDGDRNSEVRMLTEERDEALAEVERLTAERDALTAPSLNNNEPSVKCSDATVTDPADVKPGEAWLVELDGQRATALKDNDGLDGRCSIGGDTAITLVSRLVPAPRVITTVAELDALAEGSIVRDRAGHAWERYPDEDWYSTEELDDGFSSRRLADYAGSVTVLWEPDA